ncbi:MAG: hypothetical protein RJA63_1070 [Pseudomonadota bacterium]|jgi:leucyl aminopeptidase
MEFSTKVSAPEALKTPCLVLPHFAGEGFDELAGHVNEASEGALARLVARDLEEKAGSLLALPCLPGTAAERVLVVSLGKRAEYSAKVLRTALVAAGKWFASAKADKASVPAESFVSPAVSLQAVVQSATQLFAEQTYRFVAPRAKKEEAKGVRRVEFLLSDKHDKDALQGLKQGDAIAQGVALARDLGNMAGNHCTPTHLAEVATAMGKRYDFKVEVLDQAGIAKLGMGAFLAVTQGSAEPARFIVMQYKGAKGKQAPVVLVGKGLTFDSGGISLKPGEGMDEMKYDMCGGASVLGAFKALAEMKLPINVVGLIPSTENMPGGRATKPGDVVTSLSGQTIEILNTDAEGRLILCDVLTYAERFKPACVIDIATLTGACVIALGAHASGLLANDDDLAAELMAVGQETGDRCWQLPLWEEYQEQLKSNFADMGNIGGRPAGTITAACFLSRFAKAYKWAHLDIAGTAWKSGGEKGATGRPVTLLTQFLIQRARAK